MLGGCGEYPHLIQLVPSQTATTYRCNVLPCLLRHFLDEPSLQSLYEVCSARLVEARKLYQENPTKENQELFGRALKAFSDLVLRGQWPQN